MTPEIQQKLERFLPIGVTLKLVEGKVQGIIEHSFSMGADGKLVRLWWSGNAYSNFGTHHVLNGLDDARRNAAEGGGIMFDALSPECPIEIDWEKWLDATDKFYKRNAPFKTKPFAEFVLRAITAETEAKGWKQKAETTEKQLQKACEKLNQINETLNGNPNV